MYTMSIWALGIMTLPKLFSETRPTFLADPVPYIGLILLVLAVVMLLEAIRVLLFSSPAPPVTPSAKAVGVA
jgi:hypothetical protein